MSATSIRNENRDLAYHLLSPVYRRMARLIPRRVSPNCLSLLGLGSALIAVLLLLSWTNPNVCIIAALFLLLFGIFDCLDGLHARNTGQSTAFGAYLDAAVDAVAAGLIYPALIVRYQLYAPVYVFTACARPVLACLIHACTAETRVRIDPEFGSVSENLTLVLVLLACGVLPGETIAKAALLIATIALPVTALRSVLEARRLLSGRSVVQATSDADS